MATLMPRELDMEISGQSGQGERSMQEFVHLHIKSILAPFAEHLDELHKAVDDLTSELSNTNTQVTENTEAIDRHSGFISGLRADLSKTQRELVETGIRLETCIKEKAALEADHEDTKKYVREVDLKIPPLNQAVFVLQQRSDGHDLSIGTLNANLARTDENIKEYLQPSIDRLGVRVEGLDKAEQATARLLDSTKTFGEATYHQLQSLTAACEEQKRREEEGLRHVHRGLVDLGSQLKESDARVQSNAEHLKTMQKMSKALKSQLEDTINAHYAMDKRHDETVRNVSCLAEQGSRLIAAVDRLQQQAKDAEQVARNVVGLSKQVSLDSGNINVLQKTSKNHGEQLCAMRKQEDIMMQDIEAIQRLFAGLQASLSGNSHEKEKDKDRTFGGFKDLAKRIDSHAQEISNTAQLVEISSGDLQKMFQRVQTLEFQNMAMNDKIAKLSSGMDLNAEYWNGLSKGFKETQRKVAVENEMLPTKGTHAQPLETLRVPPSSPCKFSTSRLVW
eukprot:TRINITY_DN10453_c0_g1_i1.p1 TRINITY_DN10453_c0_g1~~TRINITY_DN10453_c0_g1_i1.p1  ORF type:complete len:521 (-),score=128.09 TRINITY_DN10453_c0_g1_i1:263-1780(-)